MGDSVVKYQANAENNLTPGGNRSAERSVDSFCGKVEKLLESKLSLRPENRMGWIV